MSTELTTTAAYGEILSPGRNCWTADAQVDSCGVLIDGRDYYRAFFEAACAAQKYILIAGWKFHSSVRLLRGRDARRKGQVQLFPLLRKLCEQNHELHVYILAWNFSLLYVPRWEWFLRWKFNRAHERLHFEFAGHHRFGGSHHQKFVVIDGRLAFVGGLDLNDDDWDDREHRARNNERAGEWVSATRPYHDIQAYLVGDAAAELARHFQERWRAATHCILPLKPATSVTRLNYGMPIRAHRVALSRHEERKEPGPKPTLEICKLYSDAIAAAHELIYVENQYFTAQLVGRALAQRMRDATRPTLDVVLVLPKHHDGTLESIALEPPRLRLLEFVARVARHTGHRLGVYYTAASGPGEPEIATLIHSKLLIVDDRFLTVGSANTSNRSMGLDTELNVSWEARIGDELDVEASIRRVRVNLLAEHCGLSHDAMAMNKLEHRRGLVSLLDRLAAGGTGRLRHLTREAIIGDRHWLVRLERWGFSLDPDMSSS